MESLAIIYCFFYLFVFVVGIVIGSFLNVVIYRVPKKISIAKGRSYCPKCKHKIKGYHNIPLISFIYLKGRCRYCDKKISSRYPLIELFTGLLGVALVVVFGFSIQALLYFIVGAILLCITMIDFDTMTIPNGLVIALIIPSVLSIFLIPEIGILSRIIGSLCISVPMLGLTFFIPGAFGGGDIKLMAVIGILLGWQNTLLATFIGILIGGVVGTIILLKKTQQKHMAFGPYLCIGIMTAILFGDIIIKYYLQFFGL
jgi:leader peptidase (prepilin peptidase)/N-methyltransferase